MAIGKTIIPVRAASAAASTSSCSSGACSSGCSSASAGCSSDPEYQLEQQGWVRRTTIGEPRLSEIAENYQAMGHEVHVERWSTGGASCTTCYDAADQSGAGEVWGTVYVRPAKAVANDNEMY